jgi:inositol polyphosphate 5-phosphatase INPP5B/F
MPSSTKSRNSTDADMSDWDIDQHIPGAFPEPVTPLLTPFTSTQQSLAQALHARRQEYTEPRTLRIKIGSWNVAAIKGTEKDIGGWFIEGRGVEDALTGLNAASQSELHNVNGGPALAVPEDKDGRESVEAQERRRTKESETLPKGDTGSVPGGEDVGLYVLGLQEIVDISSFTEALRPTTDPTPSNKIKAAVEEVLPLGYQLVAQEQLIGLLLLVYAHATVAPEIQNVSTTSVGTGLGGYMGNKGAVTARIILGETTRLVFVNSHLAAGADKGSLDRRNWDAGNITSRTRFAPVEDSTGVTQTYGEQIGDEDYAFWFGDLNYRLEGIPGDEVRRLLMLHTRNEYDIGQSASAIKIDKEINSPYASQTSLPASDRAGADSESIVSPTPNSSTSSSSHSRPITPEEPLPPDLDPASLQATLNSLLPHDELQQQMKKHRAFDNGWAEGPIRFLPTYKYDVGSVGMYDSSEKKRCPSWCDRILYRTRRRYEEYRQWAKEQEERRKKEEEAKAQAAKDQSDENVLFAYDPTEDGLAPPKPPGNYDYNYDETEDGDPPATSALDRDYVMTRAETESEISLEYYISHQRVLSSDHKPLSAIFSLSYDAVVPEKKTQIHAEVARELDRAENEGRPTVTLIVDKVTDADGKGTPDSSVDAVTVNFGKVSAAERKKRNITIANTGRVPATMSFVDRPSPDDTAAAPVPPWLSIHWDREPDRPKSAKSPRKGKLSSPAEYTLQPGDASTIDLVVRVEVAELIKSLNEGMATLDDILILRVQNGRDHFIPVSARWVHSGLERSIDKLKSGLEDGVRKLQGQKPTGAVGVGKANDSQAELVASPKPLG